MQILGGSHKARTTMTIAYPHSLGRQNGTGIARQSDRHAVREVTPNNPSGFLTSINFS